jgi:hypothetical protein
MLYDFPIDGLSLRKARRGTNFNRSHHLRFSINKVLLIFLQRETSWKWAHFRARHKACICIITMQHLLSPASFTCITIGSLRRPLSQREQYRLTLFRMSRNVRLDAHYSAESYLITKEYCPISFQLSLPFGHSV